MGRNSINFLRKVSPSMRGISISRVTTSGDKARILSRAINGSGAVPITSIPDSADSASVSSLRTMAESSTIRTLIFLSTIIPPPQREEGNECSFGELEAAGGWRSDSKVRTWFVRADMDRLRSAQIEDDVRFHLADHCAAHHIGDLPMTPATWAGSKTISSSHPMKFSVRVLATRSE